MVVGRDYLLKKPAGPSAPKRFLDTAVVPRAVNLAGAVEMALDRAAARAGLRPRVLLGGGAALVSAALYGAWRARDQRTQVPS